MNTPLALLVGRTITSIVVNDTKEEARFTFDDGDVWLMTHRQDCCESVRLDDVAGDLDDLIGLPLTQAEEATNSEQPRPQGYSESFTWTFYKFATIKGRVTLRWLGESNGYYSERVDFSKVGDGD